jgi:hypothetical protein
MSERKDFEMSQADQWPDKTASLWSKKHEQS